MTGSVNAQREATLRLRVFGPTGQSQEVTAVIDTGYNGTLTLPIAVVNGLSLVADVNRRVRLGDGTQRVLSFYAAEILWEGQNRKSVILSVEGDPLIGTALLDGYHLGVDFKDQGSVTITLLP